MTSADTPTFDNTGLPRLPSREATDPSRGYVAGWAHAIDAILSGKETDEVYVEAFEDVTIIAAGGNVDGIQVKDKKGAFSVTQAESCEMLERWAAGIEAKPALKLRYCSTQTAGNLHDSSDAFARWASGDHSDGTLESLRASMEAFVSRRHKGKFPRLERHLQSAATFRPFWEHLTWQLGGAGLDDLIQRLLNTIGKRFPGDPPARVRERLNAWLGAVALSASSDDIRERRWTQARLFGLDPKTDVRLAHLSNLLDQLHGEKDRQYAQTLTEILSTVRLLATRTPRHKPSLEPAVFIHAPRLDETARTLIGILAGEARLVALQGRPADGKSEVGRQLAHLLPRAHHVELSCSLDPPDAWRQALLRVARGLGGQPEPDASREQLVELVRDLLAEEQDAVLIFDNVDTVPPFNLRDLLLHGAATKCVCVGGGLHDLDAVVYLSPPDERQFRDIAALPFGGEVRLSARALELLDEIGRLTDWSPLCARAVEWHCAAERIEGDLAAFLDAIKEAGAAPLEGRIEAAVRKCWSALDPTSQRRVRFIAALGEPEIPLSWLPEELQKGPPGPWRLLERSGIAPRGRTDTIETVRVHRIVASWAEAGMEPQSVRDVAMCLVDWVHDLKQIDELKFAGSMLRALIRGFQVVTRHGVPADIPSDAVEDVRRAYMDGCGHLGLEPGALERFIRAGLAGTAIAALPPVVWGQLLDAVPERLTRTSGYLADLRREAAALLATWTDHNPPLASFVDDGQADAVDAYRHHAKELFRLKRPAEAVDLLTRLDRLCNDGYARSRDRRAWHSLQTKGLLQLARRAPPPEHPFEVRLLDVLARPDELPDYLRPAGLGLVVKAFPRLSLAVLPAVRREALIREGLELCRLRRSQVIQEEFLQSSVTGIEMAGLRTLYPEVVRSAEEMLARAAAGVGGPRRGIGHALYRAGAFGVTTEALNLLRRALPLVLGNGESFDDFQVVRACAILRDAGRPELAEPILRRVWERQRSDSREDHFWSAFELAKTWRWLNRSADVPDLLNPYRTEPKRTLGLDDELAKIAGTLSRVEDAKTTLERNAKAYDTQHTPGFAEQCRRWAAGLPAGMRDPDGLLGDMTRSRQRRDATDPEQLRALDAELDTTAARLMVR